MSDHDPNGDDDLMKKPRVIFINDDVEFNPMHKIGHGRGDDVEPVLPNRILNVSKKVEPTQPMEAVSVLTIKNIIEQLIEPYPQSWRALPKSIRDAMLDRPQDFQLRESKTMTPDIVYHGTVWRARSEQFNQFWIIADLIK